tara:strand:+ start:697 stop:915 length:219 start_codon:yes stop_codon:yes gene_type:complete
MTSEESILFREALLDDSNLCDIYLELKSSMNLLDSDPLLVPSDFSLVKIKSFARAFSSKPSKYIDRINLILN